MTDRSYPASDRIDRRTFGRLGLTALAATACPRWLWADGAPAAAATVVTDTKFARLESLTEGVWGIISKPLEGDFTTVCNGGVIAGKERVLAFDAYARTEGAQWVIDQAEAVAGRRPTDVVISHHHGDHVGGLAAFAALDPTPRVWLTSSIRDAIRDEQPEAVQALLAEAPVLETGDAKRIDLGGRTVQVTAMAGHTASDIVARVDDVSFYGDLIWHELFPNYRDARPDVLRQTITTLLRSPTAISVPGHGPRPERADLERFRDLLDEVESAARTAFDAGKTAGEAAGDYQLPASLGNWTLFNPRYFAVAFGAWYNVIDKS